MARTRRTFEMRGRAGLRVIGCAWAALLATGCGTPSDDTASKSTSAPIEAASDRVAAARDGAATIQETPTKTMSIDALADALFSRGLQDGAAAKLLGEFLAAAPSRLAGTDGARDARRWALAKLTELGLDDPHEEPVVVPGWRRIGIETVDLTIAGATRRAPISSWIGCPGSGLAGVSAPLIAFGDRAAVEASRQAARGKIVFLDFAMPNEIVDLREAFARTDAEVRAGVDAAIERGALAVLVRSVTPADDDSPRGTFARSEIAVRRPVANLDPRTAAWIAASLKADADAASSATVIVKTAGETTEQATLTANVIAEIRGASRPDEIVLLTARLDGTGVGPGAHVFGAGVIHVIEAMRLIKATGLRPERTIRAVLRIDGDLDGRALRSYVSDHNAEMRRHVVVMASDEGGFTPQGFGCRAPDQFFVETVELARVLAERGLPTFGQLTVEPTLDVLQRARVPSIVMRADVQQLYDLRDSPADTLETVHPRSLALGAAGFAVVAAVLARRE